MTEHDVVIVGLGPVGCAAAILFAHAGLTVAVVERDREVYRLPRAVNLDAELIRAFQRVGLGQQVSDLMQPLRPGDRAGFANSAREWLFGQELKDFGSNGWQPMNMFDQPELEQYLRDQALAQPGVEAFIGFEATAICSTADQVKVTVVPTDGDVATVLTAQYLVACDGAASFTRKRFDIGWQDLGYNHDWLVVDIVALEGHTLGNDTLQVCDPERIVTYVCTKDPYRRWEFKLLPGETAEQMLDEATIESLIEPWTPKGTYRVRRAAVYQFHAATADRWRVGRVFIAGDAAHQTPPFLGQGMNAGMRDVVNLAWKLPMVIDGTAGDQLLDTYFAERNAHAHDLVEWAVSVGRLMEHLAETERCQRAGQPEPAAPERLQASGYGQGREAPPIRDGVVMLDQVSDTGSTGYLFRQPVVRDQQGEEFRLDELLGPGFALVLKHSDSKETCISAASRSILQRIGARIVTLDQIEPVRGSIDRLFDTADAAIIRPDRVVFGHSSPELSVDELVTGLAERLTLVEDT